MEAKFLSNRFSRRAFLGGLGATAALPVLAACQPQVVEVVKKETVIVEKEVTVKPPTAPEKVKVRFNTWIGVHEIMPEAFNEASDKIEVVFEPTPYPQIADKQVLDLAAGTAADMMMVPGPWWASLMTKKITLAVDEGLKQRNVDLTRFAFHPDGACKFEGKLWGTPHVPAPFGLGYNIRVFDEAGVKHPTEEWTWDDLTDALIKLHNPPETYGQPAIRSHFIIEEMIWSNNGKIISDDYQRCLIDQPEALEAVQLCVDWLLKHKVMMAPGDEKVLGDIVFASDKLATAVFVIGDWNSFKNATKDLQIPAVVTWWPFAPKTKKRIASTSVHVYALNSKTKVLDEAWDYFLWHQTSDAALKIHWTLFPANWEMAKYVAEIPDEAQREFTKKRVEGLKFASATNWGTSVSEAKNAFNAEYEAALLGKKSASDAMKDTAKAITAILQGA